MQNRRNAIYTLLILSLVTGLFTGRAFFFNLAYLFGGLLLISFLWAWMSVRWISISRRTRARRAQVGRNLDEAFSIHNRSIIPKLWLEVRDHSDLPGHRASHVVPALGPRGRYQWYVETPCLVRGEFQLGPMTIVSGDPFGLFLSPRRIGATSRVIVYPATVPINHVELPVGLISGGDAQRRRAHFVTTNAAGVRDYVPGDSFNRIHWATTARKDKLMVKEFELDPLVDIWLFVDFSASSLVEDPSVQRAGRFNNIVPTSQDIPPSTEEYNVVIAASLAKYFIDSERALGFAAYTPHREIHQPERGNRQLTRILQTLAVARSLAPHSLAQMLTLETPYFTRGTTLLIITSSLDPAWVTEAQILSRKGIRPMCVLTDPESFGGPKSSAEIQALLRLAKIPTLVVRRNDDISAALEQRPL
ncbi:MAG: DUF58 domain-containing protein [Chloroflexota bacterium]|nr:MAG: DUF58 domain-containing protein [Chloroflexota bacterium]